MSTQPEAHLVPACTGGHVEHGPVLSAVDGVTPEHGINLLPQARLLCKVQQQLQGGRAGKGSKAGDAA